MSDSTPPITPLSRFGIFFLVGALVFVLALWGVLNYLPAPRHPPAKPNAGASPTPGGAKAGGGASSAAHDGTPGNRAAGIALPPGVDAAAVAQIVHTMEAALAVLNDPNNHDKVAAMQALKDALRNADPKVAIAGIRQFLAEGKDGATGQKFKVGEGGELTESPTMRTFLMDELGSLSRDQHTADAAEVAREVLDAKNSPDEWAVAMRNLAWSDPSGSKAELAGKVRELLTYGPWQQQPTGGYLEAFDAAAYAGDPVLLEVLEPLSKTPSPVQQAAIVAMDRLSAMAPGKVASYLNAHPEFMADTPLMRADYMGKVDLSDAGQLAAAETYLDRPDVTAPEKDKFLARLGVPAEFVSDNLLTPQSTATMPLLQHRALVNQVATDWLNNGRFPALQGPLQTLIANTQPTPGG